MTETANSHRELIVWQKAMDFVVVIYRLTEKLPVSEQYNLISQMKRSAISIPSNIAEGRRRLSRNDYRHFLAIAYGSGAELETQLELIRRLFGLHQETTAAESQLVEIMKMLNRMLVSLKT